MKKRALSITTNLLSLVALFLLFSSFTYLANNTAVTAETHHSLWSSLQGCALEKLSFWQKTALYLGASGGTYAVVNRHYRRHYNRDGIGCLGVLAILILIPIFIILLPILIALLPVLLVIGLVMLILGIAFPNSRRRNRRRDW